MNTENVPQELATVAERRVSVIIPYYQRSAGILARALASAMAQQLPHGITQRIIVIDDESPAPVEPELSNLTPEQRETVVILRQANGGPGAARNTGLDFAAREKTDFVAFLDSDDTWKSNHLADAIRVLEKGHDFYFCDHQRFDDTSTYSEFIKSHESIRSNSSRDTIIEECGPVIRVDNKTLFSAYLVEYLSQTSTVVIRAASIGNARFDPNLRSAGEDHMFWLLLTAKGLRAAVSYNCNVHCGRGVNIYFEAFDFGSAKVVDRVGCILLFYLTVKREFDTSASDKLQIESMIRRYRRGYSYLLLLLLAKRKAPSFALLSKLLRFDPLLGVLIPFRALSVIPTRKEEAPGW